MERVTMPKKTKSSPQELTPDKLRWSCDPASIPFQTTQELEPIGSDFGQVPLTDIVFAVGSTREAVLAAINRSVAAHENGRIGIKEQ